MLSCSTITSETLKSTLPINQDNYMPHYDTKKEENVDIESNYPVSNLETIPSDYYLKNTSVNKNHSYLQQLRSARHKFRESLAEFLSTLILVLLATGIAADQVLGVTGPRSLLAISVGNGLAVLFGIVVAGQVSGAHMNPAITISMWLFRGFPGRKVPIYCAAQFLGAFAGSAILYSVVWPALDMFDGGQRQVSGEFATIAIFSTNPPVGLRILTTVMSEAVGTGLLVLLLLVSSHPKNQPFHSAQGVIIAAGVSVLILGMGYTSGFALNPARDFGPRMFAAIAGWGMNAFTVGHYYFLVPLLAPIVGGIFGGLAYSIFVDL